jgi:hypothetical protein
MIFMQEEPRTQLMTKREVVTFRRDEHKLGFDWATDHRGGSKICDIYVTELTIAKSQESLIDFRDIEPFTRLSGFATTKDWQDAIYLRSHMGNPIGHLYLVLKV